MAGLETVVRPVVFPDIRPKTTLQVPLGSATDKLHTIAGGSSSIVPLSHSSSYSMSRQGKQKETKRKFDKVRVHDKAEGAHVKGESPKGSYMDLERVKKLWTKSSQGHDKAVTSSLLLAKPPKESNIEILEKDVIRSAAYPDEPME